MYHPHLPLFLAVADHGSFRKAAEQYGLSPATVLHRINALEEQLSLPLFRRSPHGLTLTPAGESLYRDAKKLIRESERAVARAAAAQNSASKTIRIGSSFLNPCHGLLDFWNRHAESPAAFTFQIVPYPDDHTQILSVVERLGKDIDLLVGALNSAQMHRIAEYIPLGTYALCVAMSPKHPLAGKARLSVSDLYGEQLLIPTQEQSNEFFAFLAAHPAIRAEQTHYFYDLDTFNACEQHNCLLLTLSAWETIHPSLVTLPVDWDMRVPYGLLCAKNPPPAVVSFLTQLKQLFAAAAE